MNSGIGHKLQASARRKTAALAIATVAVAMDFIVSSHTDLGGLRIIIALSAVAGLLVLTSGDMNSLGITLCPKQGYWYWGKATLIIGAGVSLFVLLATLVFWLLDISVPSPELPLAYVPRVLPDFCLKAPLLEECLYRLVLCTPLVVLIGSGWTIFVAGAVFGLLHFVYGNPGPDNFIAGYFLAWAYLKSETIVVPVVLHSLGNAIAIASQVANWYLGS